MSGGGFTFTMLSFGELPAWLAGSSLVMAYVVEMSEVGHLQLGVQVSHKNTHRALRWLGFQGRAQIVGPDQRATAPAAPML